MTDIIEVPTTPITHLYIDDLRDPVCYLGKERGSKMVWVKDWWEAKRCLRDNHEHLEEIHFDHYLAGRHTGGELFGMVMYRLGRMYPNLKRCYLHSSDSAMVATLIERNQENATKHGVELIANSNQLNR